MTEIDSLQISIESNSVVAIAGINGLASALNKLKQNGSIGVATKNLKSLSDELKGFNGSAASVGVIERVAKAVSALKDAGSVRGVANSLEKLGTALKGLDGVDVDSAKIASIASSLAPLSNVKAGGINTMMNGLMKIGKATESLNDEAINAFAERIDKLMDKLTPLSAKMTTVQSGLKAINSNAKSAGSSVRQMGEDVNASSINLSSFIYTIQEAVNWLQQAIQKFSEFIAQAVEWDGISARFGRTFGSQAEEVYGWIQRLNEEMGLNVQQFMQYSSLYAQMLTGFGVATEDARNMAVGYTELTYDIWASANDRYKTFEEAADAVASAIAGEVEPIRRAGFTIVESTLAETAAYHGLDISLESATESQKSYLRYLALVDQAHSTGTIGVYAKELNTAEGMMRTFSQQLKSLAQAFGQLFIPVLVKVMPYFQAFVNLLEEGVRWVAGLFGVEIQAVDFSGYKEGADAIGGVVDSAAGAADALGDATKAAKELKNATLGIDELNVISPQSSTGGSGGGGNAGGGVGGLDIDSLWDESIFDNIQSEVDTIKEKMRGWLPVIGAIAAGFAGLRLAKLVSDIGGIFKGLKGLSAVKMGGGPFKAIKEFFSAAKQMAPEVGWMAALFPKLSGWFASIGTALSGAATAVGGFLAGISAPVWGIIAAVVAAIASAAYFLYKNWDKVVAAVKDFAKENIGPKLESMKESFEKIKEAIGPLYDALKKMFDSVVQFFKKIDISAVLSGIGKAIEWIGGIVFSVLGGVVAGAFQMAVGMIDGFVQAISGIVQIVSGIVRAVVNIFKGDWKAVWEAVKDTGKGIVDVFKGLAKLIFKPLEDFVNGVIGFFKSLWDKLVGHSIVPDIVKGIVKWFTDLPKMVFKGIGNFFENLLGKFKGLWTSLVNWWNSKKKLSDYTPNIGSIKDKLSSAWNKAKTWWAESKAKLKEYTPTIGSIKDKLVDAWNKAKEWFNNQSLKLNIKMPHITVGWDYDIPDWQKTVADFLFDKRAIPYLDVSWYAGGGFPADGEFFMAREAGPEMVGRIGNRSAVVNNDQIVEAVSEGVYAAVASAMRATGGNGAQAVNVYLDGKQIYSSVKKTEAERGVTLMGNQLGYTY